MGKKTIRVATVQMESLNSQIETNLKNASKFVEQAIKEKAQLILLPEFMPTGYVFTNDIWDAGELNTGLTVQWAKKLSKEYKVYIGTSYLEADGEHFYNTFFITTPKGDVAGTVRKQIPAAFEAYFTAGDASDHYIDTEIGRIGVGICYENQFSFIPKLMHKHSVDFMVMPHSAPTPMPAGFLSTEKDALIFNDVVANLSQNYARLLGIPVILSNKVGKWETPLPALFGKISKIQKSSFPGLSSIADSDGTIKGQLDSNEGILVSEIILDPSLKQKEAPEYFGRKALNKTWSDSLWRVGAYYGKKSYSKSSDRIKKAREIYSAG